MKQVDKIEVFHNDTPVGVLQMTPDGNRCVFEYSKVWLKEGFSLSPLELPLESGLIYSQPDEFGNNFAIFEDSMPDGYGLYLLDRMLMKEGKRPKDLTPLERLAIVGGGGLGALIYKPQINIGKRTGGNINIDDFDDIQIKAIKILSEAGSGDEPLLYYNSSNSGGARPKIAFREIDGRHWLVKFRHTYDSPEIGKEEFLYMNTAAECGITIPRTKLMKGKYFGIERFDIEEGKRIHTATAAALLKIDFKNQGTDYTNLLALTGYLTQDPAQVEQMYRRMVFNLVCDNKDDHAKNFSFICRNGVWSIAPAYDITYSSEGTNRQHATSLFYEGNPGRELVLKAGTKIRIPQKRCEEIIRQIEDICSTRLPQYCPLK